jgi:HlyD family secretion protein
VVLTRSVEPGYAVAASLQAVELLTVATDLRELELEVDVDEADVGQVKEGQDATFTVASYPNKRFPAKLTKVAYGSTTSTDNVITYTAYLDVKNPQLELRPGMTATATINTAKSENALLVPSTALRFKPVVNNSSQKSSVGIMMPPHRTRGTKTAKEVSLAQYQRTQTVYVVDEKGGAKPVEIVTGLTNGRMTEVISGPLQAGDKVITDQLKSMP